MSAFDALGVAGSGLTVHRKWMDAVADNIANINTARPTSENAFQARYIRAQHADYGASGGGVEVTGVELGSAEGRLVHDPENPMADEDGYVRMPDIDLASQMGQLIMAQRGYQASLAAVERVQGSYQTALQIGGNA